VSVQHFQIACLEHVLRLRTVVPAAGQRPSHAIRVVSGELGPGINRSAYRRNRGLGNASECHGGGCCMTGRRYGSPVAVAKVAAPSDPPSRFPRPALSFTRSAFRQSLPSRGGT
jgi:hypothetical protein